MLLSALALRIIFFKAYVVPILGSNLPGWATTSGDKVHHEGLETRVRRLVCHRLNLSFAALVLVVVPAAAEVTQRITNSSKPLKWQRLSPTTFAGCSRSTQAILFILKRAMKLQSWQDSSSWPLTKGRNVSTRVSIVLVTELSWPSRHSIDAKSLHLYPSRVSRY